MERTLNPMHTREWTRQARQAVDPVGTHVPFIAPLLAGVSARRSREGLDFLLPNPSGGRGTYVAGWDAVSGYASPTLHDTILAARLLELASLDPAGVRAAALDVSLEGYAGPVAAEAAARTRSRLRAERLRLWSRLLMALMVASDLTEAERTDVLIGLGQAGPDTMTIGLTVLAGRLGWEADTLFETLGRLSASHAPLCTGGRIPLLLSLTEHFRGELSRELSRVQAEQGTLPPTLRRILPDLDRCLQLGRATAATVKQALEDPAALMGAARKDSLLPQLAVERVERALDGLDRVALLWQHSTTPSSRDTVLPELALMLRLAAERGRDADADPNTQPAGGEAADKTGVVPDGALVPSGAPNLVERNELIRARELALEGGNG